MIHRGHALAKFSLVVVHRPPEKRRPSTDGSKLPAYGYIWPRAKQITMFSLYVHIPFCVRKCNYCDFLSFSASDELKDQYVTALCNEIKLYSKVLSTGNKDIYTIFFGGGTPSLLTPKQLCRIMETISESFNIIDGAEVSLECNPGTVTEDKLRSFRESGINRLSIGLQSTNDHELTILGRIHTYADFKATFESARKVGFKNLNVDIISAIPGQTVLSYQNTLTEIVNHDPEHISAYSLIIEEGTKFHDLYAYDNSVSTGCPTASNRPDSKIRGSIREKQEVDIISRNLEDFENLPPLPNEEDERKMYYITREILEKAGYQRYEISNYSKPGYECMHNKVYWTGGDYVGIGLGASSLLDGYRYKNTEDILKYNALFEDKPPAPSDNAGENGPVRMMITNERLHVDITELTHKDTMEEYMFLGLRLTSGISIEGFGKKFGTSFDDIYAETVRKFEREGLLIRSGDNIRLTDRGIDVSNTVLSNFLLD